MSLVNGEYFDPTWEERERSITVPPLHSWGERMRKEKSYRVLFLGGSNSCGAGCPGNSFVKILEEFLVSLKNESTSSYLINQSHNGAPVSTFIGEVYEFESWSPCRWPNVNIIETAVNSHFGWQTAKYLDNLIFLLQEKWLSKDIPEPNFLFLELFNIVHIAKAFIGSELQENRFAHLNSFDESNQKFNRGCPGGPFINALARFYSYPMLSAVDPLWPSFLRFFLKNNPLYHSYGDFSQKNRTLWPYTYDGIHLSCKGHAFVGNEILVPFFKRQLKGKKTHNPRPVEGADDLGDENDLKIISNNITNRVRMFSPSLYVRAVTKWSSFLSSSNRRGMWSPIKENSEWNITFLDNGRHIKGDGHDCYGSIGPSKSNGIFHFKVPTFCTSCKVGLTYIHSWNESFVGDVRCEMLKIVSTGPTTSNSTAMEVAMNNGSTAIRQQSVSLGANGTMYLKGSRHSSAPVKGSVPLESFFPADVQTGEYIIECAKQDERFSCFTGIAVYNTIDSYMG